MIYSANEIDSRLSKAAPRDWNRRGHGNEGMASMHVEPSRGDQIIAATVADGHYRVDVDTGIVVGLFGRELRCPPNKYGYRCFTAVTSVGKRNISVHRLVAATAWGVDAIVGRQVAHRNGDQADNRIANLWLPATIKEHNEYDGTIANLNYQTPIKTSWPPCADCGDPDGPLKGRRTPARVSGERFGIDGQLCNRCYQKHCRNADIEKTRAYRRAWQAQDRAKNRERINARKRANYAKKRAVSS